jgi:hypothetical protein
MSHHNEITPLPAVLRSNSFQHVDLNEKGEKPEISHIEDDEATIRGTGDGKPHYTAADAKHSVGLALIDQVNTIPSAGDRIVTTKREYWSYVAFGQSPCHGAEDELMNSGRCSWNRHWNIWRYYPAGVIVSAIPWRQGRVGR